MNLGVPSVCNLPLLIKAILLHSISASCRWCVVNIIVFPFSYCNFLIKSKISLREIGSNPDVGSSRNITEGLPIIDIPKLNFLKVPLLN